MAAMGATVPPTVPDRLPSVAEAILAVSDCPLLGGRRLSLFSTCLEYFFVRLRFKDQVLSIGRQPMSDCRIGTSEVAATATFAVIPGMTVVGRFLSSSRMATISERTARNGK